MTQAAQVQVYHCFVNVNKNDFSMYLRKFCSLSARCLVNVKNIEYLCDLLCYEIGWTDIVAETLNLKWFVFNDGAYV